MCFLIEAIRLMDLIGAVNDWNRAFWGVLQVDEGNPKHDMIPFPKRIAEQLTSGVSWLPTRTYGM